MVHHVQHPILQLSEQSLPRAKKAPEQLQQKNVSSQVAEHNKSILQSTSVAELAGALTAMTKTGVVDIKAVPHADSPFTCMHVQVVLCRGIGGMFYIGNTIPWHTGLKGPALGARRSVQVLQ